MIGLIFLIIYLKKMKTPGAVDPIASVEANDQNSPSVFSPHDLPDSESDDGVFHGVELNTNNESANAQGNENT